jgi:hypothetical protein
MQGYLFSRPLPADDLERLVLETPRLRVVRDGDPVTPGPFEFGTRASARRTTSALRPLPPEPGGNALTSRVVKETG